LLIRELRNRSSHILQTVRNGGFSFIFKSVTLPKVLYRQGKSQPHVYPEDIAEFTPFYPTEHCGISGLKDNSKLLENYVAHALNKQGSEYGFSRSKKASIDRIETIKISVPDIKKQVKVIAKILPLETRIKKL